MSFRRLSLVVLLLILPLQASWGQSLPPQYEAYALSARRAFEISRFLNQSPSPRALDSTAAVLKGLIAANPENPFPYYVLGKVFRLKGYLAQADSAYAKASRVAGKELILHGMLALAFERDRQPLRAEQEFDRVRNAMIERGVSSVPVLSLALLEQGEALLTRGDAGRAEVDFRRAIEFTPPLLAAHLAMVQFAPQGRFRETLLALVQGAKPLFSGFENQLLLATNAYLILLGIVLAFSLGILASLILRTLGNLVHFLIERLPAFLPGPGRSVLVICFLVALLLARMPLSLLLLLGIAGVWVWLSKPERRLAFFAMAALALTPLLFLRAGALLFGPLDGRNPALFLSRAQEVEPNAILSSRIRTLIARDPLDPDLLLTAGFMAERSGRLEEAREDFLRQLALAPNSYRGEVGLGNVYFREGSYDSANACFQRAVDLEPLSPVAHFNLSQVYLKRLNFQGADMEFHNASRLDFRITDRFSSLIGEDTALVVANETLPLARIWSHVLRDYRIGSLPGALLREILGIDPFLNGFVAILILFVMLFLLIAGRAVLPAERCRTCGRTVCDRCQPAGAPDLCPRCARKIEGSASSEMKEAVLSAISARHKRFMIVRNGLLSLLLPGSGHVIHRRLGQGVAFLTGASILFVLFRLPSVSIPPIPTLSQETLASWRPLWWMALGLFYLALFFSLRKLLLPEGSDHGA